MSYTLYLPLTFLLPSSTPHYIPINVLLSFSFTLFNPFPFSILFAPPLCINSTFPLLTFHAVDVSACFCFCLFLFFSHTFPICPLSIFFIHFSPGSSTFLLCFSTFFCLGTFPNLRFYTFSLLLCLYLNFWLLLTNTNPL